jgi:hypothetical protein
MNNIQVHQITGNIDIKKSLTDRIVGITALVVMFTISLFWLFPSLFIKISEKATYKEQQERLNEVEKSLRDLSNFVWEQKKQLKESEDILTDLREKHTQLKPVVDLEEKTVSNILDLQASRTRAAIWSDRGYGIIFGFLTSYCANFVWYRFRRIKLSA